eukprot:gnl/TRDRNA2_/TRDRNA2_36274_c0_seq1.p1 gnl/TRDRNA2_/TRDRNA2_36274_c0~~gnl/TRDRNA2_/TRDRNA2_36274_c0_seq1.p1  ORF type:complete len:432 (+),score=72.96 gnl/TRDRNA2_/TRDRNA2_36274_c0_seq1:147-1442(+)
MMIISDSCLYLFFLVCEVGLHPVRCTDAVGMGQSAGASDAHDGLLDRVRSPWHTNLVDFDNLLLGKAPPATFGFRHYACNHCRSAPSSDMARRLTFKSINRLAVGHDVCLCHSRLGGAVHVSPAGRLSQKTDPAAGPWLNAPGLRAASKHTARAAAVASYTMHQTRLRPEALSEKQHPAMLGPLPHVRVNLQGFAHPRARDEIMVYALRNIDLPEVVFFDELVVFGQDAVVQAQAASSQAPSEDADRVLADSLAKSPVSKDAINFASDCRDVGTLVVVASRLGKYAAEAVAAAISADAYFFDDSKDELFARALKELIVTPRGNARRPNEAPRPPEPKWCVTLEADSEGAAAARLLGIRCLGVGAVDVAEAHAHVESLDGLLSEDIATPGAFWLQPLLPETPDGDVQMEESPELAEEDEMVRSILGDIDAPR